MVERANGTIKKGTILKEEYKNKQEMNSELINFLLHYILYRSHGSLRKELNVKTPYQAIEKWYDLKPEIFNQTPCEFKNWHIANKLGMSEPTFSQWQKRGNPEDKSS
ncbi:MAG: hypothetical protein ACP5DZ_01350 [Bacteroidales bacterium]